MVGYMDNVSTMVHGHSARFSPHQPTFETISIEHQVIPINATIWKILSNIFIIVKISSFT
jgi:hypothetical protein